MRIDFEQCVFKSPKWVAFFLESLQDHEGIPSTNDPPNPYSDYLLRLQHDNPDYKRGYKYVPRKPVSLISYNTNGYPAPKPRCHLVDLVINMDKVYRTCNTPANMNICQFQEWINAHNETRMFLEEQPNTMQRRLFSCVWQFYLSASLR